MAGIRSKRRLVSGLLTVVLVIGQAPVTWGDTAQDKALAAQLFKDGKTLMNAGNYKDACPKFDASAKLDPTADGTVINVALCAEGLGQWAKAWAYFNESIVRAKKAVPPRPDRERLCKEHMAAIEPKLSRVTIKVSADAHVDGLVIQWDGTPLDEAVWNTSFPVDPGTHHLAVSAPGHSTWSTDVEVGTVADNKSIDVPKLEHAKSGDVASKTPAIATAAPLVDAAPTEKKVPTMAYVLAGAGVVLIGATVVARLEANSASDDRKAACLTQVTLTCDDTGKSKIRTWETVSFVTGGLALVSVGAAVYFFVSPPKSESPPQAAYVRVVPTIGGFSLVGGF